MNIDETIFDNFDPDAYLKMYPDVVKAGINPLTHYKVHGIHEGRHGRIPDIEFIGSLDDIRSDKETILIACHEASLTGVAVVVLRLVEQLLNQYNIVVLLLDKGILTESFHTLGAIVAITPIARGNVEIANLILEPLLIKCTFKYALVNSIESRAILPILGKHKIPAVSLFHEFSAYVKPKEDFVKAVEWSAECIFDSKIIRDNACDMYPILKSYDFHVIPQGRCIPPAHLIPNINIDHERLDVKNKIRPLDAQNTFVVMGAGAVILRKGVDLFIECAARFKALRPDLPCRFVWFGKGYDPQEDLSYSMFIADQIKRAGLQDILFIFPETAAIQMAYEQADLFLLTSRLDPLPNVALDALHEGLPLVCFDKASGIADFLIEQDAARYCVADYLDTHDMAKKAALLSDFVNIRQALATQLKKEAMFHFNIQHYAEQLNKIALNATVKLADPVIPAQTGIQIPEAVINTL